MGETQALEHAHRPRVGVRGTGGEFVEADLVEGERDDPAQGLGDVAMPPVFGIQLVADVGCRGIDGGAAHTATADQLTGGAQLDGQLPAPAWAFQLPGDEAFHEVEGVLAGRALHRVVFEVARIDLPGKHGIHVRGFDLTQGQVLGMEFHGPSFQDYTHVLATTSQHGRS